jgi:hypothetical protein
VPFLLDNDVPDVVARVLVEAGHEVMLLRNVLPKKSVDSAVLDYAAANALLLITCNRDDFIPLIAVKKFQEICWQLRRIARDRVYVEREERSLVYVDLGGTGEERFEVGEISRLHSRYCFIRSCEIGPD